MSFKAEGCTNSADAQMRANEYQTNKIANKTEAKSVATKPSQKIFNGKEKKSISTLEKRKAWFKANQSNIADSIVKALIAKPELLKNGKSARFSMLLNKNREFKNLLTNYVKSAANRIKQSAFNKISAKNLLKYADKLSSYDRNLFNPEKLLMKGIKDGSIGEQDAKMAYKKYVGDIPDYEVANIQDFKGLLKQYGLHSLSEKEFNNGVKIAQKNDKNLHEILDNNGKLKSNNDLNETIVGTIQRKGGKQGLLGEEKEILHKNTQLRGLDISNWFTTKKNV